MPLLTLYKRGSWYHYRGTIAGERLRGACRTQDKARAHQIVAEEEARYWKSHIHGPEAVLTFAAAASIYRAAGKPTRFVQKVEDYWRDTLVRSITPGAIKQAAIVLYPEAAGATRNRQVLVPTVAIINYAATMELCKPIRITRFPVLKKEREHATWAWVRTFMRNASPHLGALACFMLLTGARISEALAVRWRDVDLSERRVLIRQTKVGAERRPHMPPELVIAIANIPSNRMLDETVFRYSSADTAKFPWRNAIKRAGLRPLTFHACRHGFATSMLHKKIDPVTVARLGGWKSPAHLFATYGHAMADDTLAELITDTELTQPPLAEAENDDTSYA